MGAFHLGMFPTLRSVSFASEPESWALYTIQDMLQKGHDVLIPVNLPSYHILLV